MKSTKKNVLPVLWHSINPLGSIPILDFHVQAANVDRLVLRGQAFQDLQSKKFGKILIVYRIQNCLLDLMKYYS